MLEMKNLYFETNDKKILRGINLSVKKGEILSIIGVNGTGKTTLAAILMGLNGYVPSRGKIIFDGKNITKLSITERAKLGITLAWQSPAIFEGITVREYLSLGKEENVEKLLKMVGLKPDYLDRYVDENLSGGERKRIELASVYSVTPKLAILDEPDSGIDMASTNVIKKVIRKLSEMGSSVILITHSEEMARIGDKAALLCNGKIVKYGNVRKVTEFFKEHCKSCGHIGKIDERLLK
ncbi:MAG: ABC transporter ATP-binding protein [Candidatus Aenigmarchaeota archaeon]|nr:ABC transporter ATP-binding protein [Candidatus Aenigmarchaeota archaeon]